jgi:hypothetical protein
VPLFCRSVAHVQKVPADDMTDAANSSSSIALGRYYLREIGSSDRAETSPSDDFVTDEAISLGTFGGRAMKSRRYSIDVGMSALVAQLVAAADIH